MFAKIEHLNDLVPYIVNNQQIRVKPCEITGQTVVCYMLQDEDTFDGENNEYARECRGITFDKEGKISARTLHKFFNVGERAETQPEKLRWQDVSRIMTKRDGSMVTPVLLENKTFKFKTKKSFDTKEAALADSIVADNVEMDSWIRTTLAASLTPTFEITSPKFPIVLLYEKDELTLLHIRENVSGRYLSEEELIALNSPFPLVENLKAQFVGAGIPANLVSWQLLKQYAETATGVEGVVIQFGQEMVKLKTKWYCDLHHSVTFTRWRDIARTVLADQSDDLKGAFALTGRSIEPILKVERQVKETIGNTKAAIETLVAYDKGLSAKDMAMKWKDDEQFGLIMSVFRGKKIDWLEWYSKHHLDSWSLEVV